MRTLQKVLSWFVAFLLPVALTFLGVRLLLTHTFPEIEYRTPGFPTDEYGFTLQDRLQWSGISIDYLLNDADISFLSDLTFPDGAPLFNGRELSHMQDVKNVVQPVLWVGYGVWFLVLGLGLWARFGGWWPEYVRGIWCGGWLTVGLVAVIGILAGISFWQFFTVFHELFFTGDSWLFLYSDTLIRLFPMRFWQDAFLFAGALDVLGGLALGLGLLPKRK
ncbi:MAG: TIGR01906 family membrane protein [Chloroflexi bacterium]|nr:TIGR01906 family membrane protein [Chloroflexota bacterium]